MNATGAALLDNPHPCGHLVYPYADEDRVGAAVCTFAGAGLRDGEGVILIMSADHSKSVKRRLVEQGFNAEALQRTGRLIIVDAEKLLEKFVVRGDLDECLFRSTIGALIQQVRTNVSYERAGKVRVFGEMVSQVRTTNLTATTRLEELWNEVIHRYSVALLCTYALHHAGDYIPQALIDLHSHSLEAL